MAADRRCLAGPLAQNVTLAFLPASAIPVMADLQVGSSTAAIQKRPNSHNSKGTKMSHQNPQAGFKSRPRITLDEWAVLLALAAAALIRFGVIPRIPW